jgi:hypothetical protein
MRLTQSQRIEECYNLITLVALEETDINTLQEYCQKTIKGLTELEFFVSLELENIEKSSLEIERLTNRIGF